MLVAAEDKSDLACRCRFLTQAIEEQLEEMLATKEAALSSLYEAARYAILGGGKRLRPLLCLLTGEIYDVPLEKALPVACTLELIHGYSLIHDDLPSMDNDDFRRGKPTLHRLYPEGHAILTGDYLITYAFELLSTVADIDDTTRLALIKLLAGSCGGTGMVGGQVLDLEAIGHSLSLGELQAIHRRKTGCLISASLLAGALLGKAPPEEQKHLIAAGNALGLAFQIVDDLLDADSSHKKRSSDLENHKATYATILGTAEARRHALICLETISSELAKLGRPSQNLLELATFIISRKA